MPTSPHFAGSKASSSLPVRAASITETLWDVGIDTLEGHRRKGHARACYLALASHLAAQGFSPVWGAYEDNEASLAMAESLGFIPVDEFWVIELS